MATVSQSSSLSGAIRRCRDADGFTLLELLVVALMVGILAAIALPSFLSQTTKATDVQAKVLVRTAQTTAESIAASHDGSYESVTAEELRAEEPAIQTKAGHGTAYLSKANGGASEYSLTATATNGDELTVARDSGGRVSRTCVSPILKTGCSGSETSSW